MKPLPSDRLIWRERTRRRQYPQIAPDAGMHIVFYALSPDRLKYYVVDGTTEELEAFYKEHPDWDLKWAPDFDEIRPTALEIKFEDFRGRAEDTLEWVIAGCFLIVFSLLAVYLIYSFTHCFSNMRF